MLVKTYKQKLQTATIVKIHSRCMERVKLSSRDKFDSPTKHFHVRVQGVLAILKT